MLDKGSACLWVYRASVLALLIAILRAVTAVSWSVADCYSECESIKKDFSKFSSPLGFDGLGSLATQSRVGYLSDDVKKIADKLEDLESEIKEVSRVVSLLQWK